MCNTLLINFPKRPVRPKFWTQRGLRFLGSLIRQAREKNGWSLEDLSRHIYQATGEKPAKKTLGNLENGVGEPKYNTIAAVAALRFVVDPEEKPLTEFDFIDIASEFPSTIFKKMTVADLIIHAIAINRLSDSEIYQKLKELHMKGLSPLTIQSFETFRKGYSKLPSDDELRAIRETVDPFENAFTENQWLKAANFLKSDNFFDYGESQLNHQK